MFPAPSPRVDGPATEEDEDDCAVPLPVVPEATLWQAAIRSSTESSTKIWVMVTSFVCPILRTRLMALVWGENAGKGEMRELHNPHK